MARCRPRPPRLLGLHLEARQARRNGKPPQLICRHVKQNFCFLGKYFDSVFRNIVIISAYPASTRGTYRDRHDTWGGERWLQNSASVIFRADERCVADGKGVRAWRPSGRC
jgi:hypothetical protein